MSVRTREKYPSEADAGRGDDRGNAPFAPPCLTPTADGGRGPKEPWVAG